MSRLRFAVLSLVLLAGACASRVAEPPEPGASAARRRPALAVLGLTCEHRVDPLGVDALPPRLCWKLAPTDEAARGLAQSAYQVLVASDMEQLARERGDRWDSGRVASSETVDVAYAGLPLGSNAHCVWKVRVWDQDGVASAWSEVARFSTGLLAPADWRAEWIGLDAPTQRPEPISPFTGARWIWFAGDPDEAPAGERFFRASITLPEKAQSARLALSADNQCELYVNGTSVHQSEGDDAWRRPAQLDVLERLLPGENVLAVRAWNEGAGPAGLLARLQVQLEDGTRLELASDASWSVHGELVPGWETRDFDAGAWPRARELAPYGGGPWGLLEPLELFLPPPRLLRCEFTAHARPVRATLFASALGLVDLELNGRRVGDELFTPGWTDYTKRVPYRAHDVTALVRDGANALGAVLGDGWYSGYVGYGGRRDHYGTKTRALVQLELEFADSTRQFVTSDGRWRASTGGTLEADFLMGERHDARLEPLGWSEPGFDAAGWSPVDVGAEVAPVLGAHPGPPVRVVAELLPREVWSTGPDTFVCDLGQNIAGFARLALRGEAGQELTLRFAERLNPDRTLYTTNLRGARATDVYVCRGGGGSEGDIETWQPRFTFHGFQYVEISGLGRAPAPGELVALAVTSDTPYVGELETSEPALARLMENIRWTQRMNFIDVPTDCPQRDERLGWTGDAQVYARTASWNADVHAFFTKWLVDLADAQRADGQLPMVAPLKVAGDDGGPAWADAGVIVPWEMFRAYGDERLLARAYPTMQRFLDFCVARSGDDCLPPEEFHCFGDWVSVGAVTPKEVIYTAYFALCARLMEEAALALGRPDDARRYAGLHARVKQAFDKAYVQDDGRVLGDTQCAYALALSFDLVEGERRARVVERLVADIEARGGHFSTGFVGTKDLLLALNAIGREDLAYRLLLNRTYPSWLFSIEHGATSIWERWDGWTPERGFQDPGMNSFAHYAFGAVGQWMFETIGGLAPAEPGFRRLHLAPKPGGGLTHARASHDSIRGRVELAWRLEGGTLLFDVRVPPNTAATLVVPTRAPESVREGGQPLEGRSGVTLRGVMDGGVHVELASGRYSFTCDSPILAGG
jgi:alpha-L-rhamnosidase